MILGLTFGPFISAAGIIYLVAHTIWMTFAVRRVVPSQRCVVTNHRNIHYYTDAPVCFCVSKGLPAVCELSTVHDIEVRQNRLQVYHGRGKGEAQQIYTVALSVDYNSMIYLEGITDVDDFKAALQPPNLGGNNYDQFGQRMETVVRPAREPFSGPAFRLG